MLVRFRLLRVSCFDDADTLVNSEGQQLRYCGYGVGYEDVIITGNPDEMKV